MEVENDQVDDRRDLEEVPRPILSRFPGLVPTLIPVEVPRGGNIHPPFPIQPEALQEPQEVPQA